MTRFGVLTLIGVCVFSPPAFAAEGVGIAGLYDTGSDRGISATAQVGYSQPSDVPNDPPSRSLALSGDGASSPPAPVAISAHNCVPRMDPRGISLSFEFSEGTVSDCISFVAPERPTRGPRRPPARRRPPDPEQLALQAFDRVIALAPQPELDVAPATMGLTGLPSYFWVDSRPSLVTARASAGPLTVTAEARPARYLWDFGDGATKTTAHPGTPWTKTRPGDIAHLYETKGRYDVSVEIVWAARWRVSGGAWRDLGYFSTSGSRPYPVREIIAMLVRRD